ncbi:MAG: hypothetical protein ACLPN6_15770 [Streptosporangiaceae bacterium]
MPPGAPARHPAARHPAARHPDDGFPGGWLGGQAVWLGSVLRGASPFDAPWRRDKGGLWDLGPHVVSQLWASLGPVVAVTAEAGPPGLTHLILRHEGGPSSTATVTLSTPAPAQGLQLQLWGEAGRSVMPAIADEPGAALRTALAELAAAIRVRRACPSLRCPVRLAGLARPA